MGEHIGALSFIVILITFILFAAALFTTGFTHDVLLEAGVFLVSVKLITMAYKNSVTNKRIVEDLRDIKTLLSKEHC